MASSIDSATFDHSFDNTFGVRAIPSAVAVPACRSEGVQLFWESPTQGWGHWLFQGKSEIDRSVTAVGSYQKAKLQKDSYRLGQRQMTIRTGSLPADVAEIVAGVFESVRVFMLTPGADGKEQAVPVYVEPAVVPIFRDAEGMANIEVRIQFGSRQSQRG